jgi:nucleoside-diphosphate-sugar epimerase
MHIVVTGGSGFIGSRLAETLARHGHSVTTIDVVPRGFDGCRALQVSVLDADALVDSLEGADAVVHLAGFVREGIRREPAQGTTLQVQGTLNVLEACQRHGIPDMLYASSFYVYDGVPSTETVDENTPLDVRDMELFGATKMMGEVLGRDYERRGQPRCTVLRFGPVYGPGCSSAVGTFTQTGLRGDVIEVWGRGERRNQYTYVGDVVDAIEAALASPGETYDVISPESTSLAELAQLLEEEFGFQARFDVTRGEGPSFPYISAERTMEKLGWQPIDLREGVRRTVRELQEQAAGDGG